jgi:hypothetical protein
MSLVFYNDFFNTEIMNHCEFLKTLPELGKDDIELIKAIIGNVSCNISKKPLTKPFYNNHQDLPKNIICILESYILIKNLKSHEFNIFEYAFLAGGSEFRWEQSSENAIKIFSFLTLLFQYLILTIMVIYNVPTTINYDPLVLIITIGTSFFFTKLAYNQYTNSTNFNKCYKLMGDPNKQIYLHMNFLSNVVLPILVPFFNFYYILLSEDPNNAILNSLALFFILELDSMILPSWSESMLNDECVTNIHDYIMYNEMYSNEDITIQKITENVDDIHNFDNKTYVQIQKIHKKIIFYVRETDVSFLTIEYQISGKNWDKFLDLICQFDCIIQYDDIHD